MRLDANSRDVRLFGLLSASLSVGGGDDAHAVVRMRGRFVCERSHLELGEAERKSLCERKSLVHIASLASGVRIFGSACFFPYNSVPPTLLARGVDAMDGGGGSDDGAPVLPTHQSATEHAVAQQNTQLWRKRGVRLFSHAIGLDGPVERDVSLLLGQYALWASCMLVLNKAGRRRRGGGEREKGAEACFTHH